MGIRGGEYRSPFFGDDVLNNRRADRFATMIYNKKRYGIVSERNLIVLAEAGQTLTYERNDHEANWRSVSVTTNQGEVAQDAIALLSVAERLLVNGCYTTAGKTEAPRIAKLDYR